ncbi:MAG: hypothetical protein U1E76_15305 [Planctomycetota bacterium]
MRSHATIIVLIGIVVIGLLGACAAPEERGFTPNAIVEASEGRWHVLATSFNIVSGDKHRLEWDLALRAISPDALAFEIFENGRRTQWGEQTFTLDADHKTVRVAQWSQAEGVDKRLTLAGGGRLDGYALLMELVTDDGARLRSAHYFVHPDRLVATDEMEGQWRTEEIRERRK